MTTQPVDQPEQPSTQPVQSVAKPKRRGPRGAQINRCPDCSRMVSLEMGDPEDEGLSVEVDGDIQDDLTQGWKMEGDVKCVLQCSECGTDLAEATLTFEIEGEITHTEQCTQENEPELTLNIDLASADRMVGKGRYPKHEYGAEVSGTVECKCGATADVKDEQYEAASGFESTS